jgi:hypothetical protein
MASATGLNNLALVLRYQGDLAGARPLIARREKRPTSRRMIPMDNVIE